MESSSEANMTKLHAEIRAPLDDKLHSLDAEETKVTSTDPNMTVNGTVKMPSALAEPLDDHFYNLDLQEIAFYKTQTGIQDDARLKQHVVRVHHDAYEVFPYPCIRWFSFLKVKIARHPAYDQLLKLGGENDALFIDVGCCFGNDVRKAVVDGFPSKNCIATDIQGAFWNLGHRLFNDTLETFPVPFIEGDILNTAFLDVSPPVYTETVPGPPPDLAKLTTLTPLTGRLSAIHISMVFHLFAEDKQLYLARALACLLARAPGGMIFGWHIVWHSGELETGIMKEAKLPNGKPVPSFSHSVESWKDLWDGQVFEKGSVAVRAELLPLELPVPVPTGAQVWQLVWSVTRV